jgi:hypothetical protein
LHEGYLGMTQLFNELVEFLESVEKGESPPLMGPAHQELMQLQEQQVEPEDHQSL